MWWGERDEDPRYHGVELVILKQYLIGLPSFDFVAAVVGHKKDIILVR